MPKGTITSQQQESERKISSIAWTRKQPLRLSIKIDVGWQVPVGFFTSFLLAHVRRDSRADLPSCAPHVHGPASAHVVPGGASALQAKRRERRRPLHATFGDRQRSGSMLRAACKSASVQACSLTPSVTPVGRVACGQRSSRLRIHPITANASRLRHLQPISHPPAGAPSLAWWR